MSDLPSSAKPATVGVAKAASFARPGRMHVMRGAVIAAFACGIWYLGIRPMEQTLAAKRAELNSISTQLADYERGVSTEESLGRAINALSERARHVNSWTAASGDASKLYEAFRTLAAKCSVRIERVEPSVVARSPRASGTSTAASEVFGYSIEVSGTYLAVAQFMDACEQDLGVTKVVSFHMSASNAPGAGAGSPTDPVIVAIIETSHLKLTIPSAGPAPAKLKPTSPETGS